MWERNDPGHSKMSIMWESNDPGHSVMRERERGREFQDKPRNVYNNLLQWFSLHPAQLKAENDW